MAMANKLGTRAIIEQEGSILIVKETKNNKGVYGLPGGTVDSSESLVECAIRETFEETGLVTAPEYLVGIYQEPNTKQGNNVTDFIFMSQALAGQRKTSRTHPEVDFYTYDDIEKMSQRGELRSQRILDAIQDYRRGQRFPLDVLRIVRSTMQK